MLYYKIAFIVLTSIASGLIVYKITVYLLEQSQKRPNFLAENEVMVINILANDEIVTGEAYYIDNQNIFFRYSNEDETYIFMYVKSKDTYLQLSGPKVGPIKII